MNKIAIKTISVLISLVFFTQCDKSVESTTAEEFIAVNSENIEKIGEFHNECVVNMLSDFDWNAPNFEAELINRFNLLDYNRTGKKSNYTVDFIKKKCNTEQNVKQLEQDLSFEAFSIVEEVISLCENVVSYEDFLDEIEKIEQSKLLLSLDEKEQFVILSSISIWKNSAYLWLPEDMGGSGIGYNYMKNKNSNLKSVEKWTLKEALIADGVSGGVGCLGVVVAGLLGPIGWTALAIAAGESAVSSIIGGFM